MENRDFTEALEAYQKSVFEREKDILPEGLIFTNNFDEGFAFRQELLKMVPRLYGLYIREVDAIIDLVADKTCEDLRKKGFLSEESKEILKR